MVLIAIFLFLSIFAGLNGAGTAFGYTAYYFAGLFFLSAMFDTVFGISGMFMSTFVPPEELFKSSFMFFVIGFLLSHLPKTRQDRLKEWDNFRRKYLLIPYFLVGSKLPPQYVALNRIACAKCP